MNLNEAIEALSLIDVENISKLDDLPNDVGGLSAAQLKAEFDKGNKDLKEFLLELIGAIIAGDEAAARGITQQGMPGSMIQNGTITAEKLMSIAGAEAVTGDNIRDGSVTEPKLGSELALKINNTVSGVETNLSRIRSTEASISNLQTSINNLFQNKQNRYKELSINLSSGSTDWTVTATGVTPTSLVFVGAKTQEDADEIGSKKIFCTRQATNSLSFTAKRATSRLVSLNVAIFD